MFLPDINLWLGLAAKGVTRVLPPNKRGWPFASPSATGSPRAIWGPLRTLYPRPSNHSRGADPTVDSQTFASCMISTQTVCVPAWSGILNDLEITRLGELILACLDLITNDPGDGHLFSIREGVTGSPEVRCLQIDLDLAGLAGNFGSDDDPADWVGIEGPLNKLGHQQSTAVFLRPSKCPET